MKKIFYLAAILLAFVSCSSEPSKNDKHLARVCTQSGEYANCRMSVLKVEYQDHEYLMFGWGGGRCLVHNPDCKKCKTKTEYMPTEYLY
jgi:hypothetical protein